MPGPTSLFGHPRASKGGRVQGNGTNLMSSQWRGSWRGEDVDVSSFEALGFEVGTIGFQVFEHSVQGFWDALHNAIDSPPGIFPTDLFPNLYLYLNTADPTFHLLPLSRIFSCENDTGNVKNSAISFNFSGRSNGGFTVATGSF